MDARGEPLSDPLRHGPGVLVLPAVAVDVAGPASLLAWAALLCVSALIATSFAALGSHYPDSGGVSSFVGRAFGDSAATVVGWWLVAAVPAGVVAGAVTAAGYLGAVFHATRPALIGIAVSVLGAVYGANLLRLRVSARAQVVLTALVVAMLVMVLVVSAPHVDPDNATPFAPHGLAGVGSAAAVLFTCVCGWEATANLSADFTSARQVRRTALVSVVVVVVLYAGLAVCTVGVLGAQAGRAPAPLMRLLGSTESAWTAGAVSMTAVLLTVAASVTFVAASARTALSVARRRHPTLLMATHHSALQRSVTRQSAAAAVVAAAVALTPSLVTVETLMRIFAVLLACVTLAGLAAAVRLLPTVRHRGCAVTAALAVGAVTVFAGLFLLAPAAVATAAMLARRRRSPEPSSPPLQEKGSRIDDATSLYAASMKAQIR
ncbi:APC family permease [Micromonospora sp. WMMD980]|uniref:APC family permease n=1 Tax=Micromonospora sp. WMMD980 TaxID=3016088 RepID=UPI0024163C8E|nr:APC family permease [Micromonospora sp. WMMD980]MDG4803597.1 APC family permease [Micromonospora sp. WMMD980]